MTINARRASTCPTCGQRIEAGDRITVEDGVWMHDRCTGQRAPSQMRAPGKASPKQVGYASRLIERMGSGGWYDSDAGQFGGRPPTDAELTAMSSRVISDLISSLREEF